MKHPVRDLMAQSVVVAAALSDPERRIDERFNPDRLGVEIDRADDRSAIDCLPIRNDRAHVPEFYRQAQ